MGEHPQRTQRDQTAPRRARGWRGKKQYSGRVLAKQGKMRGKTPSERAGVPEYRSFADPHTEGPSLHTQVSYRSPLEAKSERPSSIGLSPAHAALPIPPQSDLGEGWGSN